MTRIVALVDGSIYSHSVCNHAAWVAGRCGAAVDLLHVLGRREGPEAADPPNAIRLGARPALQGELAALDAQRALLVASRGDAILEDARSILEKAGVGEITASLRHGDLVETVAEREPDAAMILIGKRGEAEDFAKGHLGSNIERIVRASHKPVLVASRGFKPIEKVLLAFDGGESAQNAVAHIAQSGLYAGLAVDVISVGPVTAEVRAALAAAQAVLRAAGLTAEVGVIPGQPEIALTKLVEAANFDLVVMGAYGHSRVRSLTIGSTTTEMIRSCKVPVVLVR